MKYLFLLLALGLGYEGYTNPEIFQSAYGRAHAMVTGTGSGEAAKTPSVTEAIAALPLPPAPVPGGKAVGAPLPTGAPKAVNSVAESQKAAVAKYPDLSVANSEMNSRFVFRYKRLLAEKSPRLQDPGWPLQLADECASAIADDKAQTASRKASSKAPKLASAQKTVAP